MTSLRTALLTGAAIAIASVGIAKADIYNPTWSVSVWNTTSGLIGGNNLINAAESPAPTVAATATFTYSGPLNFDIGSVPAAQNTFGAFFGAAAPASIANTIMSSTGGTNYSYLEFTLNNPNETIAPGTSISITHDDGASIYANGTAVTSSPGETISQTNTGMLPAGALTSLTVDYVEANGAPSVLTVNVPEPGSLILLGTGLLGLGLIARRRRTL